MPKDLQSPYLRYGIAVVSVLVATTVRLLLDRWLGDQFPFATLFFAVLVSAWLGGFGPGLLATLLGAALSSRVLLVWTQDNPDAKYNFGGLILYLLVSLGIAFLGGAMRRTAKRLAKSATLALEQREQWRTMLASIGDGLIVTDAQGRITVLNHVAEKLTGWSMNDAKDMKLEQVFPIRNEHSGQVTENPVTRVLKEGVIVGLANHTILTARDGSRRPIDDSAAPIRNKNGDISGVVLVFRDVTERRELEREVSRSREWFRTALASIGDGVITTDIEGRVSFLNAVAAQLTGWTETEAIGRRLEETFRVINEYTRAVVENPATRALREGSAVGLANHCILIGKDGGETPIDDTAAPIRDEQGNVQGVVLIFRDVGDRRHAEMARARMAAIVESSDDAIVTKNLDGVLTSWNRGAERLYGYTSDEVLGKPFSILVPGERSDEIAKIVELFRDGRRIDHFDTVRRTRSGKLVDVSLSYSPLKDESGQIVAVSAIARDVTERKSIERRRSARLAVSQILAEARDLRRAIPDILRNVCEGLGWRVGALWLLDGQKRMLTCLDAYSTDGPSTQAFVEATRAMSFAPGEGFPGRVWNARKPTWISDVASDTEVRRRELAMAAGLHGGVGCPLVLGESVLGVIEFFSQDIREPDADMLEMIGTLGGLIGQFVERRRAEEALRASEQRIRLVTDHAPVLISNSDLDRRYKYVNKSFADRFGVTQEEVIGRRVVDVIGRAAYASIAPYIDEVLTGKSVEFETEVTYDDASVRSIQASYVPELDAAGRVGGWVGVVLDITERKNVERQFVEEARVTETLNHIGSSLAAELDVHRLVQIVTDELTQITGAQFGAFFYNVFNSQGESYTLYTLAGVPREAFSRFPMPRNTAIFDPTFKGAGPVRLDDVTKDPRFGKNDPYFGMPTGHLPVHSYLAVPVISRSGQVLGGLFLGHPSVGVFTARHERIAVGVASQAAIALDNATLFDTVRESEAKFRQLADSMPQIVWTARADGRVDYFNRRWYEFTGLAPGELSDNWAAVLHPADIERTQATWAKSVRTGEPYQIEYRFAHKSSSTYRWQLGRALPVRSADGQITRWFGTCTDIDDQKRAEQSLRLLADASSALSRLVDVESTLQKVARLAVPQFADWCAVSMANATGTLDELAVAHVDPDKIRWVKDLTKRYPTEPDAAHGALYVLRSGKSEMMEEIPEELLLKNAHDDEHRRSILALQLTSYMCVPLKVRGKTIGVITYCSAESKRRYRAADLTLAEEVARRAAVAIENAQLYQEIRDAHRRKDEFLAVLAHELRNPLAPVTNALQILRIAGVDPGVAENARAMMERQVQQLVRLVDDLLDVSRIMRGKIELRKERLDLASITARAIETAQPVIDMHGHTLAVHLPDVPVEVDADPIRLAQAISNLLTNASKYTEKPGRIELAIAREKDDAVVRVRDTGIGIDPSTLGQIFDMFMQAKSSAALAQGGLGIGLTLVKNLVEMHGGSVAAFSEGLGKGSEFVIRIPIAQTTEREHKKSPPDGLRLGTTKPVRLLVVDDNVDAAQSLAMLLRLLGHEVQVANSGPEALEAMKKSLPEIVLLDLGMPEWDGFEVVRRIRNEPAWGGLMVVALTGWGQEEDRRRTKEAGFDHHLVKPVDINELTGILYTVESYIR